MVVVKKFCKVNLAIIFLIAFLPVILAQEQENEQEVTEEFFYAEEEVEIASLKSKKVEEAPGIVSVITAQQIKDMGARDLNDVLKMVPGFQLAVTSWYANTYGVRALKQDYNNRILVMMDGVPLNEPHGGTSSINWSDMPINNVRKIEVIRGPGSALYGTYAFLAVINIVTNNADDIDGVEISAGGGSWNTQHHYLLAGKKFGDFSIAGYIDYRKSDGYDNYFIQSDIMTLLYSYVPSLPSASMAPGNIRVPLDSKRVDVRMGYKDFEFQFKAQDYERGFPLIAYAITDGFFEEDKSYIAKAIYNRELNDKLSLSLKGNYYYRKLHIFGQAFPKGVFGPLLPGVGARGFFSDGIKNDSVMISNIIGFQSQFNYALSEKNIIAFGAEYTYSKTDRPIALINMDTTTGLQSDQFFEMTTSSQASLMDRDADRKVLAAFLQDSLQIVENLNLTVGFRVDHYSDFGSTINPRLSLVWKLIENTNIKLLYGYAFRAPTFNELYSASPTIIGNENLGPEKVRSFEIGLNHSFNPNINASINYFHNTLTDIILPTGEIIISTYPPQLENSGKVHAQGIEAEVKADFKKNTYAYFNYSYAKAKDELTGEVVPNVANNLFNFGVNIGAWKYLNANLNVNYVGERKRGLLTGFLDPRDPIKAYSLTDLTLRAQNFWKNTEIILSIHNLFNTKYTDPEEQGIIYYDFPREGIHVLGKVIFKF